MKHLPRILFLPGIDPRPHAVVVDQVPDADLRLAPPALLGDGPQLLQRR